MNARQTQRPNSRPEWLASMGFSSAFLSPRVAAFSSPRVSAFLSPPLLVLMTFTTGCATRPMPGNDWQRPVDLHFSYDSFNNVNLDVVCQTKTADGAVTARTQPICKSISLILATHGATTPEEREKIALLGQLDASSAKTATETNAETNAGAMTETSTEPLTHLTLEITKGPTVTEGCGLLAISTILTFGILPCSSIRTTSTQIRVLDAHGTAIEDHAMIQNERRIYGSSALVLLIDRRASHERRESDYRFIRFVENRVYTAALRAHALMPESTGL